MFSVKKVLSVNLAGVLVCYSVTGLSATPNPIHKSKQTHTTSTPSAPLIQSHTTANVSSFYLGLLYIQPYSDDLKYATFVSGTQPYYQSWHYQAIDPSYHPAFELGFNYAIPQSFYSVAGHWTHIYTNDTDYKQASTNTDLSTVEFVGPPYEMSPPVFGIKNVNSKVNFAFDNVVINAVKWVEVSSHIQTKFFGGLDVLRLNQTITTNFGDYAGSPATDYSYALPADPSFAFQTQNVSEYLGAGPNAGIDIRYTTDSGFGFMGEFTGLMTVGTIKANDYFTSTSARLTSLGIGTSHQEISSPNATQVVFGMDSKLGIFYKFHGVKISNFTIEAGYRLATYLNAISTVNPNTLVQPGTYTATPEFATGTMAIVSTNAASHPFSFNGLFLNLEVSMS